MLIWTCPNCSEIFANETFLKLTSGESVYGEITICPNCREGLLADFTNRAVDERLTTLPENAVINGDFSWQTPLLKKLVKKFANAEDKILLGICEHLAVLSRRLDKIEATLK